MRELRSVLIFVVAIILILTLASCEEKKKPTEPDITPGEMIHVPGGTFTMGDTKGGGYDDARPTHTVTLNSFYIGKYEVTQAEYSKYMQPTNPWTSSDGLGNNNPAYDVSWYAVIKYCNLRSLAEGLTPCYTIDGSTNPADWGEVPNKSDHPNSPIWETITCNFDTNGYRLPTEAEWEYAARGATNDPDYLYSGSNDINTVAWYEGNNPSYRYQPVGKKVPNGIGAHDMSGNVEEWCWDWYSNSYYSDGPENNPTGPTTGWYRLLRGGYRNDEAKYCTVSCRLSHRPFDSYFMFGFRVCRSKID